MDSLTHTFTIIGVLSGIFLIFFKILRDDNKRLETRLSGEINKLDTKIDKLDTRLTGEIKNLDTKIDKLDTRLTGEIKNLDTKIDKLDGRVNVLEQKISHMDGQLTQVTQMLYFKPPHHVVLQWTCTSCGSDNAEVRPLCWWCGKTR